MALEIKHIDVNKVKGTLDGVLDFEVEQANGSVIARIQDWSRELAGHSARTVAEMRMLSYESIASYRLHQRSMGS
ncbi:hypothetical protein [Sulfitobacter sp. R18_1]|uniref:hypothetical protein n=1 Tax=Sulfitobacter sp. R18_1 TaxID=2821104 RepID=UPI001AD96785|nr:hypothetical protein [Sulfitobacter sp. R18_1]MBO9428682.1 hypothetical protein [Sulfitobacter sp. R18_1]